MFFRLFLFFCGAVCAVAQTKSLSLDAAIRLAWSNDPAVTALSLAPEAARGREEQAGIRPNPELQLRGGAPVNGDSEWNVGIGLSQRLPRRDRIELARALARLGGAAAELHLREQRRLVAGEVRRLYYEIAVLQTRREAARSTLDAQHELRGAMERRRVAGEIGSADLELLALETTRAEQTLAFAEAEWKAATEQLRHRLRIAADAPLAFDANLETILARPIPDGAGASLETARPALALGAHHVRQAEATLALVRAESRGDWTVAGGLDFERRANDVTGQLENEPRLDVSASVPWPRTIANRGELREKQAELRIAEAELAAARNQLAAELDAASAAARALQPVLAAYRGAVAASAGIPASLRAAYERGEITSLQLAQARQQRFALEGDFLNAFARYAAALAEAETAAGLVPSLP